MYLVNLNLAIKVCVKVQGKSPYKVCVKVHVLTKLTKCLIQYLQESLIQAGVLDKETEVQSITERCKLITDKNNL